MQNFETSALIHQIGWSLIHSLWQDALIGLVLAAILQLLWRAKPQSRYLAACTALAVMVILPVMTAHFFNNRQITALDPGVDDDYAAVLSDDTGFENESASGSQRNAGAQPMIWIKSTVAGRWNALEQVERFLPWLILLWLAGVAVYAVKLGGGLYYAANLRHLPETVPHPKLDEAVDELAAKLSIKRKIKIYQSSKITVPMTIGWIYPFILIPPSALMGLTPFQLQTIIAHELIHIKRYDFLVNFLQYAAESLLFYHPAVIWTSRRIRTEREYVCDDLTVAWCDDSIGYARALTQVARFQSRTQPLAVAATGGELKNRIRRLVADSQNPSFAKKSVLPKIQAIVIISLFPAVIFGGLKIFSGRQETAFKNTSAGGVIEAGKNEAGNNRPAGEYDDLSREDPHFREIALKALENHRGSVIIMNPSSGQVYTIVNQDWAFRRQWPAASTFKILTSLAGIEENQLRASGQGFGYSSLEHLNLAKALAVSDNDYFKTLGQNLGAGTLINYAGRFGLGERTGIDYPDEISGSLPAEMSSDVRDWIGATGGDIQITPLQLAVLMSTVFNGGKILIPQPAGGNATVVAQERSTVRISESALKELKKGLWAAVETGTGRGAQQKNYKVGGKTGTVAHHDTTIGLFASYGIGSNSEMVVVVALDGKDERGAIAAQVAGKIYHAL